MFENILSPEALAELVARVWEWVELNVLVLSTAVQSLAIAAMFGIAWFAAGRLRGWLERYVDHPNVGRSIRILMPVLMQLLWLILLTLAVAISNTMQWPVRVIDSLAGLLLAWIAIRLVSQLVRNPILSTLFVWVAWTMAALNLLNWWPQTVAILESFQWSVGELNITLYSIIQSTIALAVLLSMAMYLTGILEARIKTSRTLSPSLQVLFVKSLKIVLVVLAVVIAVDTVGIDLTALAVFGGAIGLGVGFGLQKIVSNLISGVILLLDKSIKPGDVIAISGTYGWVTALGGRYVSVVTRDGVEHLIPNETLISERVENWTHSNRETRLKVDVGVHYDTDIHQAMALCLEAVAETERVLQRPEARCLLIEFGDSSVNLQVRFWIADAQNGVQNVKSAVLLAIWDKFRANNIEIPYPQRDLHLRSGFQGREPDAMSFVVSQPSTAAPAGSE